MSVHYIYIEDTVECKRKVSVYMCQYGALNSLTRSLCMEHTTVCTYIGPCVSVGPILWYSDLLCEPLMIMDHTKVGPCASIGYNAAVIPAV